MAAEPKENVKFEKLTHTKKFDQLIACGDLYSLPVTAVPGCGFLLGTLLKREGISRASDLYECYKKKKSKEFAKYLSCKFGPWNAVYGRTVIRAFEDWEKANAPKEEKKKEEKKVEEKKKGPPRKVGPGSKKWDDFMKREDLKKVSVRRIPGIASILAGELKQQKYCNAQQLMDQFIGTKKGQCHGDDKLFYKWILCCFGYWNTQYSKAVLEALKAWGKAHDEKFQEKLKPSEAGDAAKEEQPVVKEEGAGNAAEEGETEANDNQDENEAEPLLSLLGEGADAVPAADDA